jgi:phospholipid-binding lipoprotein MlaA
VCRLIAVLALLTLIPFAAACGTVSGALDSIASAPPADVSSATLPPPDEERVSALASDPGGDEAVADSRAALGEALPPAAAQWMQQPFGERPASDVVSAPSAAGLVHAVEPRAEEVPGASAAAVPDVVAGGDPAEGMAQARESVLDAEPEDYDPWEAYNERMFALNYNIDRYVMKPAANVYRHIMPEPFQQMIANGFDNLRYPPRLVNHILQGRFWGAFIETSRFVINTTMGFGGVFNPATEYFGIQRSRADFGQTLHRWGVGPGPFFVPPFLPPATVRDFIGRLVDSAINPISWFLLNFWPEAFSIGVGEMLNERALNYEAFQGVEETTLDLYTAVRDGYLRRRERQLRLDTE